VLTISVQFRLDSYKLIHACMNLTKIDQKPLMVGVFILGFLRDWAVLISVPKHAFGIEHSHIVRQTFFFFSYLSSPSVC
jgi:hypothetical protein